MQKSGGFVDTLRKTIEVARKDKEMRERWLRVQTKVDNMSAPFEVEHKGVGEKRKSVTNNGEHVREQ